MIVSFPLSPIRGCIVLGVWELNLGKVTVCPITRRPLNRTSCEDSPIKLKMTPHFHMNSDSSTFILQETESQYCSPSLDQITGTAMMEAPGTEMFTPEGESALLYAPASLSSIMEPRWPSHQILIRQIQSTPLLICACDRLCTATITLSYF